MDRNKVIKKIIGDELKSSVDELTEAIVEDITEGYKNDLEPVEIYANRIRQQVHEDLRLFRERFLKGYEAIIEELIDEENEPPPGSLKM